MITVTAKALSNIGIGDFKVKVNDRRLLKAILLKSGFGMGQLDSVGITIDKLDKIGINGVREELDKKGFTDESIKNLALILEDRPFTLDTARKLCGEDEESFKNIEFILDSVKTISDGGIAIEYDISLIRGQGYYTGTVLEIESTNFKVAIAGGGRYDNLIGKFLNETVPAVGFSIGFERIVSILIDMNYQIPDNRKRIALIYEEKDFAGAMKFADKLREDSEVALFIRPKKVGKFIDKLEEQGFDGFYILGQVEEINYFKK